MNYRRNKVCGGTFFFTVVTHLRQKMLVTSYARDFLRRAFRDVGAHHPFTLEAVVLLPDHLHMLMRLPADEYDFSIRVGGIKRRFTDLWLSEGCAESPISDGKKAKRYRGVWQARFWEHTIRNTADFKRHLDYIHVNPVKHSLVERVRDWPWSSFHRYARMGEYEPDWAGHIELPHKVEYFWAD